MKKLLHSLTGALLAAAAIAPQAQAAITVDELTQWGGNAIEVFYGDLNQGGVILWTNATPVIKKVSNSQFKIEGICDGDYDLTVDYNSSNQTITIPDGRTLVARNASWDGNVSGLSNSYNYSSSYGWFYNYSDASTTGKVQKIDEDLYLITINKCEFGMSETVAPQFEAINIWVFRTNSNVEDYVGTSTTPRKYKALVANYGDGFKIYNFANRGFGYKVSVNDFTASNSSLQAMEGYLMDDGLVSIKTNYANSLNQEYVMRNRNGYFTNYGNVQTWSWFGTPEGDYSDIRSEIAGTYHHDNPSHVNDDETHWVSHNGKCRTYAQLVMELTPYAMFHVDDKNEYYEGEWGAIVNNTVYTIDESDVTHSVEMSMHDRGYAVTPTIGTYVKGHVTPVKNKQHVDHYELYIVKGVHTDAYSNAFDAEKGFVNAEPILASYAYTASNGKKSLAAAAASDTPAVIPAEGGDFEYMVPEDVVEATKGHTLFVKTVYKDEHNLHPTFHALTTMNNTTTGIEDLELDSTAADISAVAGGIVVEGYEGNVEVYTAAGVQVYAGVADGTISVAPGLYIVKAGSRVEKLNVR